jgi:ribosomal-protein-alanine acetyltransferase
MEVKIETATIKLLDKLYELETTCFDQEAFTRRQIAYLLTDYNTVALIAKINGEVQGFIIVQAEIENDALYGHIITINVSSNCRRKGIATKLLTETELILKQRGINEIRLEVREDNNSAIKLYQKVGFQKMGRLETYYGKKHGLYFEKKL